MKYDSRQAIEAIDNRLVKIETILVELQANHLPHIYTELQRLGGRPSWVVVTIITFLASLSSVLLSIVLK